MLESKAETPLLLRIKMQQVKETISGAAEVVMVLVVLGMAEGSGQLVGETDNNH